MSKGNVERSFGGRLRSGLRLLGRSPIQFFRELWDRLIIFEQWYVYSWTPSDLPAAEIDEEITVHPLTADDLRECCERTDRLGEQARIFFAERGISSAFGFVRDGVLVHTSWVYTAAEYEREPFATLELHAREAEIKHCYTVERYRGQGLYRYAIRYLSGLRFGGGDERVFMTVDPANGSSVKGIENAGLTRCGHVWRVYAAPFPFTKRWAVRRVTRA
jgi:hypothetical protein